MKSNYEIEKLADWHYDPQGDPNTDEFYWIRNINELSTREKSSILSVIQDPYANGGVKRVHIGAPALQVNNTHINERTEAMRTHGYNNEDYFIEFNNDVFDSLAKQLKDVHNLSYEHHCGILIPAGQCMPVHGDTYSYLQRLMKEKHPEVQYDLTKNARRYMVFLTDWTWGQSFGAGNTLKSQWKVGETYTWKHKLLHWCSNASATRPILFFEITGLEL